MFEKKLTLRWFKLTALLMFACAQLRGATPSPAIEINFSQLEQKQNTQTIGWRFTVNSTIWVTHLGVFDANLNGLAEAHEVGIWTISGVLVVTTSVPAGVDGTLEGAFRFVPTFPSSLPPGEYVIGADYLDGGPDWNAASATSMQIRPQIAFGNSRYSGLGKPRFSFPDIAQNATNNHFGPNFMFVDPSPIITAAPQSQTVVAGRPVGFSVSATGEELTYQWRRNGTDITGAIGSTLALGPARAELAGEYSVVVMAGNGTSVTSAPPAVLAVSPRRAGGVSAWGDNQFGQSTTPIAGQSGVVAIALGSTSLRTVVLKEDGSVIYWGLIGGDDTGPPSAVQSGVVEVAAGTWHTLALKVDGSVFAWGYEDHGKTNVPVAARSGVITVAAGDDHSVALKNDGSVIVWGDNTYGQTNVPTSASSGVVAISAGRVHTVALKNDGSVLAWGGNSEGQTNVPAAARSGVVAISAGYDFNAALKSDGSVVAWGSDYYGETNVPVSAQSEVVSISAGGWHMLAWKMDGSIIAWGGGSTVEDTDNDGQAIVPAGAQSGALQISAGLTHSVVLKSLPPVIATQPVSQSVIAGRNAFFSVAATGHSPISYQWRRDGVDIPGASNAFFVTQPARANLAGEYTVEVSNQFSSVVSASSTLSVMPVPRGKVIAWGFNSDGQTNVPPAAQSDVIHISGGYSHTVAVKANGSVVAWGSNVSGETVVPIEAQSGVIRVAASRWPFSQRFTVALKDDGSVVAWGSNAYGQTTVPLSAQSGVVDIAVGDQHVLALKDDGTIVSWGDGSDGQRSIPPEIQGKVAGIAAAYRFSFFLLNDGSVVTVGADLYGARSVPPSAQSRVVAISTQGAFNLALKSDGSVVAWGDNRNEQSTVPVASQSGVWAVSAGMNYSLALKYDGSVIAWGGKVAPESSDYGQASVIPDALQGIVAISAGAFHSVVLRATECVVPPLDLVGWWRAESVILNEAGETRGELRNGADFGPGKSGVAFRFDGIDDYVTLGRVIDDFAAGSFTIGMWVKSDLTFVNSRRLFSKTQSQPFGGSGIEIYVNTEDNVGFWVQGTNSSKAIITSAKLVANDWNHVAITRAGGMLNVYINGILQSSEAGPAGSLINAAPITLGAFGEGLEDFFPGLIDDVFVAARALSAAEIAAVYSADSAGFCPLLGVAPAVGRPLGGGAVSVGGNWTLSATTDPAGPFSFRWYRNGILVDGATGYNLPITGATADDAGDYYVVVSSPYGQRASEAVRLEVSLPPQIILGPLPQDIPAGLGNKLSLDVLVSGSSPFTYQWIKDGVDIPGATSSIYEVAAPAPAHSGNFRVRVSNAYGSVTTDPVLVGVFAPLTITAQPVGANTSIGQRVELSVQVNGAGPFTYQWQLNGQNIDGATSPTYVIPVVQFEDGGSYTVVVSDPGGAVTSDVADVILAGITAGVARDNFEDPNPKILEPFGSEVRTTNTFATRQLLEPEHAGKAGQRSVWFRWTAPTKGRAHFSTAGSSFDTLLGVYLGNTLDTLETVVSDDDNGPFSTSELTFNANAGQLYHIAVDGLGDANGSVVLTLKFTQDAIIAPIIAENGQPISQTVVPGAPAQFSVIAANATAYQWRFNGLDMPNETGPTLIIPSTAQDHVGTYEVRVTGTGMDVFSQPALLQVASNPDDLDVLAFDKLFDALFVIPNDVSGGPPIARAGGSFGSAPAARGVLGAGSYHLASTVGGTKEKGEPNHAGEAGGASTWFLIIPETVGALEVTTEGSDFDTVLAVYSCLANALTFRDLTPVGAHNPVGATPGASRVVVQTVAGRRYYCAVDGVAGARGRVKFNYRMAAPPAITEHPVSQAILVGGNVTLRAHASNATPADYQWRRNGVNLENGRIDVMTFNQINAATAGEYTCVVTTFAGTAVTRPATVTVFPAEPIRAQRPTFSGNRIRFRIEGGTAQPLKLQSSRNLKDWTDVLVQAATTGWIDFEAATTEMDPGMFYRITQ